MTDVQPALSLDLCSHYLCRPSRKATHFTNVRRVSDDAVFTLLWCDGHKGPESKPLSAATTSGRVSALAVRPRTAAAASEGSTYEGRARRVPDAPSPPPPGGHGPDGTT